jgi:hypothetical protein
MCKALANKLEVFLHHHSICRILYVSITRVKEERIRNEHVRMMFYDITRIGKMIAARQMDFIGKIVRASPYCSAQQMLTACCDNIRPVGRPFLHTKGYIIKNLRLLFANVPEVTIDKRAGFKKPSMENTGHNLSAADCLTNRHASLPTHPDDWPRPRQSPRNHDAPPRVQQLFLDMLNFARWHQ